MKRRRLSSWTSDTDELLMGLSRPLLAGLRPVVISPTGSIPEGRREVASLVVIVLRTHYDNELGDGGHPTRALGLRGRPCRQCVTSPTNDECVNAARRFLPRQICDHR